MSSLKATQADGYYIPPSYIDSNAYKKQSLNSFNNSKGHNQYLTKSIIRFELPYDGFCLNESCGCHIGKGTRFNAKKTHVDMYYTTKIWEFTMMCRACSKQTFRIRTDPKSRCFEYLEGIKRKNEEYDTVDAQTLGIIDTDIAGNSIIPFSTQSQNHYQNDSTTIPEINPLSKLEKNALGERKVLSDRDAMDYLLNHNHKTMHNDSHSNSILRSKYRTLRNKQKRRVREAQELGLEKGIELQDSTPEDLLYAKSIFAQGSIVSEKKWKEGEKKKWKDIRTCSIFETGKKHKANTQQSRTKRIRGIQDYERKGNSNSQQEGMMIKDDSHPKDLNLNINTDQPSKMTKKSPGSYTNSNDSSRGNDGLISKSCNDDEDGENDDIRENPSSSSIPAATIRENVSSTSVLSSLQLYYSDSE